MVFAAGCGGAPQVATGDEAKSMKASDYTDDLDGLATYFSAYGYINPLQTDANVTMDASLIGAKAGKKYTEYKVKNVTIELYEFDTAKPTATADEIISEVKNKGKFSILELPEVNAYLSDSGKFMMIYNDTSINDEKPDENSENFKHREEVLERFKSFKGKTK
jgi:hypothetical protein